MYHHNLQTRKEELKESSSPPATMARIMAQGPQKARNAMSVASKALQETMSYAEQREAHRKSQRKEEDRSDSESDIEQLLHRKASHPITPTTNFKRITMLKAKANRWNRISRSAIKKTLTNIFIDSVLQHDSHVNITNEWLSSTGPEIVYAGDSDGSANFGETGRLTFNNDTGFDDHARFAVPINYVSNGLVAPACQQTIVSSALDKFSRHINIANYGHVTTDFLDNAYQYFPDDLLPLIHGDFGGYGPIAAEPQDGTHGLEQEELSALADTVKDVHHYNGGKMDKLGAASLQDGALDVTSARSPH
jgi:hypothetical protein